VFDEAIATKAVRIDDNNTMFSDLSKARDDYFVVMDESLRALKVLRSRFY